MEEIYLVISNYNSNEYTNLQVIESAFESEYDAACYIKDYFDSIINDPDYYWAKYINSGDTIEGMPTYVTFASDKSDNPETKFEIYTDNVKFYPRKV